MTPTALVSIARLRRLVVTLADGDADERWLADGLRRYFADAPMGLASLDLALDLDPGPGGVSWHEEERRAQRDRLLRDMAVRHFPGQRPGAAAKGVLVAWRRYTRNRLAIERRCGETAAAVGSIEAAMFELARLDGPPAERQVRNILAAAEQSNAA